MIANNSVVFTLLYSNSKFVTVWPVLETVGFIDKMHCHSPFGERSFLGWFVAANSANFNELFWSNGFCFESNVPSQIEMMNFLKKNREAGIILLKAVENDAEMERGEWRITVWWPVGGSGNGLWSAFVPCLSLAKLENQQNYSVFLVQKRQFIGYLLEKIDWFYCHFSVC